MWWRGTHFISVKLHSPAAAAAGQHSKSATLALNLSSAHWRFSMKGFKPGVWKVVQGDLLTWSWYFSLREESFYVEFEQLPNIQSVWKVNFLHLSKAASFSEIAGPCLLTLLLQAIRIWIKGFGRIHFAITTSSFGNLDKYIVQLWQKHLAI